MYFSASPRRQLLGTFWKPQDCDFWTSRSQLAVALTAAQLSCHTTSTPRRESAKACPAPTGTRSTPRPTQQPAAAPCALGGHSGLSHLSLSQVSCQQGHVPAMGVIWDGRTCPARFTCSDTQVLHRCDHARWRIAMHEPAPREQSRAECTPGWSPMLSSTLEPYSDFTWSITSYHRIIQH